MAYLDKFHLIVGDTILECQRIEHDIKMIYAGMSTGNFAQNLEESNKIALATVLAELEQLDNSRGTPYLTRDDYRLLKEIKNIRNWLVHKCYVDFLYDQGARWQDNLNQSYNKLLDFHRRMKSLADQVENARLEILKHFGRL